MGGGGVEVGLGGVQVNSGLGVTTYPRKLILLIAVIIIYKVHILIVFC